MRNPELLATEQVGVGTPQFVLIHGLFGRGRNWTSVARILAAAGYSSLLVDLPDHGRSEWTDSFSYPEYTRRLAATLSAQLEMIRPILVGHSLGGRVAMLTALQHPELLSGLVVVDIGPTPSGQVDRFRIPITAMQSLDLSTLKSRADADQALQAHIPNAAVREFLLQNLRSRPSWHWQHNLRLLGRSLAALAEWPTVGGSYDGHTLWLVGGASGYTNAQDAVVMPTLFPRLERQVIPDAGHWVPTERPEAVAAALIAFAAG